MEVYQSSFMDHYDIIWGLIIYGNGNVDAKTVAKTSEVSKFFHHLSITSDIARCYWKSGVVKYFNHYYQEDLLNKVDKTFKELFYCYLTKFNEITSKYHRNYKSHYRLSEKKCLKFCALLDPLKEYLSVPTANRLAQFYFSYCLEYTTLKLGSEEIIKYYTLSADQGFTKAQYRLATIYEDGRGVSVDTKLKFKYYKLAADQQINKLNVKRKIDLFTQKVMSERVNLEEAFLHYKTLIYHDVCNEKLLFVAARCHEEGLDTEVNVKRALNYYKVITNNFFMSDSSPIVKVANCYEEGIGTPENIMEAIKYYKVYTRWAHSHR